MKYQVIMENGKPVLAIAIPVDDAILAGAPPSKSGKTKIVASTNGFTSIGLPGGKVVQLSLNATTK